VNRFEENQDWERYARDLDVAWKQEYQRQTVAYQQLQIEMTKLLRLIQESQRNQSDFMTETAQMFDSYSNDYHDLRKDVMSFINESRTSMSQIQGLETVFSRDTQIKFEEIMSKLDQVIASLAQPSTPSALVRESSQLFQPSKSGLSPSIQATQEFSNTYIRESSHPIRTSYSLSTVPTRESSAFQQESKGVNN
jgi:hypothetical protein